VPEKITRLIHITDPHLHAHAESRMRGVNTFDSFCRVIKHCMQDSAEVDGIIATGDLVQDETRAGYQRFYDTLAPHRLPVYCVPGNHDSPDTMQSVLETPPFQFGGVTQLGAWTAIFLNTFSPGDDGGNLDQQELDRLSKVLTENSRSHILIGLHHHPIPMGSGWLDGVALRNADEFLAIIDQHQNVRCTVWGHVHQASDRVRNGVRMLSTPATCSQFLPGHDSFAVDTRPPGYRQLQLRENGTVDTEVVWVD
jgi:Icc protein